ncbi:MAG: MarR family transcriptional regulator [Shinella sp.]|nr:MAG: MarR family transcriptional regulator [Shinella sp.]
MSEKTDKVDAILAQWARERPDLDTRAMGLFGRLARLRIHVGREIEDVLRQHGLTSSSFDVLATLRRSGAPYRLSPGELLDTLMVTSGTMTNRIDQLEKQNFVERIVNPDDRRSVLIGLTETGLALVDETVTDHVANQNRLVSALSEEDQETFDRLLRTYLASFE